MRNETDCSVWASIASVLYKVQKLLQYSEDTQKLFKAFVQSLLEDVGKTTAWDAVPEESELT